MGPMTLTNGIDYQQITAIVRSAVTLMGGLLVNRGYMEGRDVETLVGVGLALASLIWSLVHKQQVAKAIDTALALPPGSTKDDLREVLATEAKAPA